MKVSLNRGWIAFFIIMPCLHNAPSLAAEGCDPNGLLDPASSAGAVKVDEAAIAHESHSLYDLVRKGEANLAYRHPSLVMNAPQRIASWIRYGGTKTIPDPQNPQKNIEIYPVFSGGIPESGGLQIVGKYEPIQTVVNYIKAAARGDGSASKMLLLTGPAGTAKSYFLNILSKLAQYLTAINPDFYVYTYEWKDLKGFPELHPVLNLQADGNGGVFEHPFPCPINESPLNLLPDAYASEVVKLAKERARALSEFPPTPTRYHCPHCQNIRMAVLKQYMKTHGLASLTPRQELEALAPHVRIKRQVIGANGSMAKLDAEARDVDYQGLLTSPNAFVFQSYGQSHPMSYYLSGKILRSNGNLLVFDEFFRNASEFRDQALNIIEEKTVRKGGAPEISLDTVVIGASNYESIEKAKAEGGARAHLDRARITPMRYELNPYLVAKTLFLMKNPATFLQQELTPLNATDVSETDGELAPMQAYKPVTVANLNEIFPLPQRGQPLLGPDYRFNLWVSTGNENNPVHISPHTILYMAHVIAGTRLVTDVAKAEKFGQKSVINTAIFRDVYTRLRVLTGEYEIEPAMMTELQSLSRDLKEGDEGMSERDAANAWLTQAIAEAQRPENGNCLTPGLARTVLKQLLEENIIQYPNNKVRLHWQLIDGQISTEYLIPIIQGDVFTAFSSGMGAVNSVYQETFQEILALSKDKNATHYLAPNGERRPIDFTRYAELKAIYGEQEHRSFLEGEVMTFHAENGISSGPRRHNGWLKAVKTYLARRATDLISYEDIERSADPANGGGRDARAKASEIRHVMTRDLGYCDHCMKFAMHLAKHQMKKKH